MSERAAQQDPGGSRQTAGAFLTAREAAQRLGVHERTIRRAIARGDLPAHKEGGVFRIPASALDHVAPTRPVPRLVRLPPPDDGRAPLPSPLSPFVGRRDDLATITRLLRDPAVRVLTLTGPGGIGKTRLAIAAATAVAAEFPDGAVFVDLAPITGEGLVLPAIAAALGVSEPVRHDLRQRLRAALRFRRLLLLLDNCEHLPIATTIAELLLEAPGVTALLTSRAPLRISGEYEVPVPALSLPVRGLPFAADAVLASDAGRLFVERTRAVDPSFHLDGTTAPAAAEICARLDGLPLAIELAAARGKVLPPQLLLERLTPALPFLHGGPRDAPQRHRTLRDTIGWSYALLSPDEQALFRRLSVFAGGFTLDAAEGVTAAARLQGEKEDEGSPSPPSPPERSGTPSVLDLIAALLDQSLLVRERGPRGEPRFRMLETIHEYGRERLAAHGEEVAARTAHAAYFLRFAQALRPWVNARASRDPLERMAADDANLRAAMQWFEERGEHAALASMVAACYVHWYFVSPPRDVERLLRRALAGHGDAPTVDRARLVIGCAEFVMLGGEPAEAGPLFSEGIALLRAIGDPFDLAMALTSCGASLNAAGEYAAGASHLRDALAVTETFADPGLRAAVAGRALANLSDSARGCGDLELAVQYGEDALARYRGHDFELAENRTLLDLGNIARDQGNDRLAVARFLACLERTGERGEKRLLPDALEGIASAAAAWGQARAASLLFGAAAALRERVGISLTLPPDVVLVRRELDALRAARGPEQVAAWWTEGQALPLTEAIRVATAVAPPAGTPPLAGFAPQAPLTRREREVLRLLAARRTDREIADALFLSPHTVHWHVRRILAKLGAASRQQAVTLAVAEGLV
jgi:excisionase family DNA binding protein